MLANHEAHISSILQSDTRQRTARSPSLLGTLYSEFHSPDLFIHVCARLCFSYNCESPSYAGAGNSLQFMLGGGEGHLSKECTEAQKPKACYKCGAEGHLVRYRSS